MSGGDTPKQGPQAPPPSTPSGSRFGSFMTQPVLVVALIALVVAVPLAIGSLSGGGGEGSGSNSAPSSTPPPGFRADIAGDYTGQAPIRGGRGVAQVELEIESDGRGFLARSTTAGTCAGELRFRRTSSRRTVFGYTEAEGPASCPRRTTVTVRRLGSGELRFNETRRGRVLLSGRLQPA
jgi:hypothetical protein